MKTFLASSKGADRFYVAGKRGREREAPVDKKVWYCAWTFLPESVPSSPLLWLASGLVVVAFWILIKDQEFFQTDWLGWSADFCLCLYDWQVDSASWALPLLCSFFSFICVENPPGRLNWTAKRFYIRAWDRIFEFVFWSFTCVGLHQLLNLCWELYWVCGGFLGVQ